MRRLLAAILALALLLTSVTPVAAYTSIRSLTNDYRADHGLRPLWTNDNLHRLAAIRARQISVTWEHAFWWQAETSCAWVGENIAFRKPALSGESRRERWFVNAWIDSPPHRELMLGHWRRTASAIYLANGGMYGVQLFCLLR